MFHNHVRTFVANGLASLNAASIRSVSSPSKEQDVMD